MKKIWLEVARPSQSSSRRLWVLRWIFGVLVFFAFVFFSLYARLTWWFLSPNKIDIFNDLDQISFYFWVIDPEISRQLLTLDDVVKSYLRGENVLKSKEEELLQLRQYARSQKTYLSKMGFSNYERIFQMLDDAWPLREEIFQLLGRDKNYNYLIPLQNSNEARPNWGFFGSFAFVSLSGGHIEDLQVVDSYLPDYISPNSRVNLPGWIVDILWSRAVWFIAGNKFGFTDKDGQNLKLLYEKIFHTDFDPEKKARLFKPDERNKLFKKDIKGVVFLDSELITYLLPSFRQKAWEWQFVNANIDLIRGAVLSNKKDLYIKDLNSYLKQNALRMASAAINTVQELLHKGYVNVYLSNVSAQMWGFLQAYDLTTVYQPDMLYLWNINTAFNKSDGFSKKQVEIQDLNGVVVASSDQKKFSIKNIASGEYKLVITYTFDLPKSYQDEMLALQEKYHIKMTDRERYILSLQDFSADPSMPRHWRETREMIYFPPEWKIWTIHGDFREYASFNADFTHGVTYLTEITQNPHTNRVEIQISVP